MEERKKNSIVFTILLVLLYGCSSNKNMKNSLELYKVSQDLYEFDKKTIADAYLNNVEYFRLHYPFTVITQYMHSKDSLEARQINDLLERHFLNYPKVKDDDASFYIPHACRFSLKMNGFVNSPVPTKEQVFVSTDSIFYNKDASLCIAFLCVEEKSDDIEGLEKEKHSFSAVAMVGYRKHPKDTLSTYPLTICKLRSNYEKSSIVEDLIKLYTTRLKGTILPWSVYENNIFNHNVGEKGFFTDSPLFMKYNDTTYSFQMYRALGKDYRYDYPYQ